MNELVVLVPGLGFGGVELLPLAWRLRRRRHRARVFYYAAWCRSISASAAALNAWLAAIDADSVHFVAHSLGGLVVLRLYQAHTWSKPGRLVTLGTPNGECLAARRIARVPGGRWILGRGLNSALSVIPIPVPADRDTGAIAGRLNVGVGLLLGLPAPNDSVVRVEEAIYPGVSDTSIVAVSHSGMLISTRIAEQVDRFLRTGRFAPAAALILENDEHD